MLEVNGVLRATLRSSAMAAIGFMVLSPCGFALAVRDELYVVRRPCNVKSQHRLLQPVPPEAACIESRRHSVVSAVGKRHGAAYRAHLTQCNVRACLRSARLVR